MIIDEIVLVNGSSKLPRNIGLRFFLQATVSLNPGRSVGLGYANLTELHTHSMLLR